MNQRNSPCWCGSLKKWKHCHYPTKPPASPISWEESRRIYKKKYGILLKDTQQIDGIRKACAVTANILALLAEAAQEGVTTNELDLLSQKLHRQFHAIPAPLNYGSPPFPKTICTSLNEVICHGIPNDLPLQQGDILNIDVSCIVDGYYGDCSQMVIIGGNTSEEKRLVCQASKECLDRAIQILQPGLPIYKIGNAISDHAATYGFSVVDQFVGHGVGLHFHEEPHIPHHRNRTNTPLHEGMVFTIEPMINVGVKTGVIDPHNHWEARTQDLKPSAQWEHTVLITSSGYEILTLPN